MLQGKQVLSQKIALIKTFDSLAIFYFGSNILDTDSRPMSSFQYLYIYLLIVASWMEKFLQVEFFQVKLVGYP